MDNYIDIYCERLEPGLFAEPLNAVTNVAFFIAAFYAYRLAHKRDIIGAHIGILLLLLFGIGLGSALFHTFATPMTQLADILPILLFQIMFLITYSRQIIRLGWSQTLGLLLIFAALIRFFEGFLGEMLNGSMGYIPALIFLTGFGIYHVYKREIERFSILAAAMLFVISLALRSLDMALCDQMPMGVHFLWHILNAGVLYLTLRGLMMNIRHKV